MKKFIILLAFLAVLPTYAIAATQNSANNVAAAGSLTGSTLAAGVTGSSLTSVGTIGTGVWHGTPIGQAYGGTGFDASSSTGVGQWSSGTYSVSTALASSSTATTQSTSDSSTALATTAFVANRTAANRIRTIGFSVLAPSTGQQGTYAVFPVAGTITGWSIVTDAGTATVKTWKIASGSTSPSISNNISTNGVALASGTAIESNTVSDFTTTTVNAGDIFAFNLSAVSGVNKMLFQLQITVN